MAIAYDPTQNYTKGSRGEVRSELEARGVEVTAFEQIQPGKNDYSGVVDKLAAGKPDAIYAAVYYPEGALIAKAMSRDSSPTCLLDYGSYDTGYVEDAGEPRPATATWSACPRPTISRARRPTSPTTRTIRRGAGHLEPLHLRLAERPRHGVEQAGGFDAKALTSALNEVRGWKGWTGSITLEPGTGNRNPVVGDYDIDVLVDSCVAVEVKVAPQYDKRDEAQLLNELKATGLKVGLLVNFGRTKVEYKRLVF